MRSLQSELDMSILMITHDLGVVANMADEVVVIYHGEVMEAGSAEDIFRRPQHPYLKALLHALPHFNMKPGERLTALRDTSADLAPLIEARRDVKKAVQTSSSPPILAVRNLRKTWPGKRSGLLGRRAEKAIAVDDVSFDIRRGECLGLVGESGSGKTSVSKLVMRAIRADSGSVTFNDGSGPIDVLGLRGNDRRAFRSRMQMIFQDPVSSLSPRMTVLNILREPLQIHGVGTVDEQMKRVGDLMSAVGLDRRFLSRYPHSFSGGQRQRIGIARALALNPDLIICDEPVSALDVSVQAQVLNLLKDLQRELGLTYLFISHNLAVVDYVADRIAVLANGRIVEIAPREVLFHNPAHPYTKALLKAVPFADLDHPLDFAALAVKGASNPKNWSPQFVAEASSETLVPIDLGHGHSVLARSNVDRRELV